MKRGVTSARYIPEVRGSDSLWSPVWYAPVEYGRAREIRDAAHASGLDRDNVRVRYVPETERGTL